jgi:hypothetical protein
MRCIPFITIFLVISFTVAGQTNYPPNSPPWNDNPTNWVYDCSFTGYGNVSIDASNLPCGYYDEPLITNSIFVPPVFSSTALQISILWITNYYGYSFTTHGFTIPVTEVNLQVTNEVPGTTYEVFASTNLESWSGTPIFTYTSTSNFDDLSYVIYDSSFANPPSPMFFRAYGQEPEFYRVIRTVPVGHEPYLLFSVGVFTSFALFHSLRYFW